MLNIFPSNVRLPSLSSLVDDQDGLNNYADAILTEQDRFKNHSKDWKSSLTIDHPSIQVVRGLLPLCLTLLLLQ